MCVVICSGCGDEVHVSSARKALSMNFHVNVYCEECRVKLFGTLYPNSSTYGLDDVDQLDK